MSPYTMMTGYFPPGISLASSALLLLSAAFLLWRAWMFSIRPKLLPSEPRYMPYWIPFFGHFRSFFSNCHQLIDDSTGYFKDTNEPFALQLCGVKIYCLSRPEDVSGILDGAPWAHGLDFTHFVKDVMQKFGVSKEDIRRAEYTPQPGDACYFEGNTINPKHLDFTRFVEDLYKRQFLDTSNLDRLSTAFVQSLSSSLQIDKLNFCMNNSSTRVHDRESQAARREVSLYALVTKIMVEATVKALFGPCLHQVEPDIVNQLIDFNAHAWILFYGLPDFFGFAPICEPRTRIKAALRAFVRMPEDQRSEQCYAFKQILRWMDVLGFSEESRVGFLFLFFFASIANEQNACYWFVAHIIYDRALLELVKEEIEPAWGSGELNVKFLTSSCPTLDSVFNETLRQRTNTFAWRIVKEKTTIRGKELQPGVPVIIPMRLLHLNEQVWGPTVDMFDPSRFVRKKTLARQPYYRPFASGPTFCPGRVLAKQETYAFLALLLRRFDVDLLPPRGHFFHKKQPFPLMEINRPPTGVKGPRPDTDLYIRLEAKTEIA